MQAMEGISQVIDEERSASIWGSEREASCCRLLRCSFSQPDDQLLPQLIVLLVAQ